jgi:hypothetical protein
MGDVELDRDCADLGGLSLLAFIYCYGFKPALVLLTSLYLAFVVYQGEFRFRLIVPLILLVQIYVDRRGRRWPTLSSTLLLVLGGLLFFPLKEIGRQWQAGDPMQQIWQDGVRRSRRFSAAAIPIKRFSISSPAPSLSPTSTANSFGEARIPDCSL